MSEWIECFGRKPDLPGDAVIEALWDDGSPWNGSQVLRYIPHQVFESVSPYLKAYRLAVERQEPSTCEYGHAWQAHDETCKECGMRWRDYRAVREGKQVTKHWVFPEDQRGAAAKEADACRPCVRPPEQSAPHLTREQYENLHGPKREPAFVFSRDRFGFLVRYPELREVTRHAELPLSAWRRWK